MRQTKQFYLYFLLITAVIMIGSVSRFTSKPPVNDDHLPNHQAVLSAEHFVALVKAVDSTEVDNLTAVVSQNWHNSYIPALLEVYDFASSDYTAEQIITLLEAHTGQSFGNNIPAWYQWLWNEPADVTTEYIRFKSLLYLHVDPIFEQYFSGRFAQTTIRMDEIRWGGVVQDGIPPLRKPKMISASAADYLQDSNIVFGIEINGDARAYPKRILAWHEMFIDTIGGEEIAGVYCTLCGTVIPYKTLHHGVNYQLGTSGFLYRSNKLMYDRKTQSLWNTLTGKPVVGPLAANDIQLEFLSVVTTTWAEWKRRHPDTTVLSPNTGHRRNYGEGVAYQRYFSTDQLLFNTPFNDTRLKNKQEVLALRFTASPKEQLAIDTDFLMRHPLYTDQIGQQKLLILTDKSGANRVYDPQNVIFTHYDNEQSIIDSTGLLWKVDEEFLISETGQKLNRLPSHRAFWFGWYAAFPETRLVKLN
ncbi:MAG: DUF3179 domain-containing protein [Pseudomonadales bacterium]|nr:DUF3179 domain-containing protein [Pseudomonadales bacterium]MCP5173273.1 DUF3179 domain-containing protein [Pseudomonadales bacterium]